MLIVGVTINAQHIISINNKQQLTINEDDDNSSKKLVIKLKPSYPAKALLTVKDVKERKDWLRTYNISDEQDNVLLTFNKTANAGVQQTAIQTVLKKLEAGKKYFLYIWAKPANPKMAAAVRIRRVLLCTVAIK